MKVTSKYGFIKMIPDGCIDINNVKIIQVDIVGDKLQLKDPEDGTIYYQR